MSKELSYNVAILKDRIDNQQIQLDALLHALEALEQIVRTLDPKSPRKTLHLNG